MATWNGRGRGRREEILARCRGRGAARLAIPAPPEGLPPPIAIVPPPPPRLSLLFHGWTVRLGDMSLFQETVPAGRRHAGYEYVALICRSLTVLDSLGQDLLPRSWGLPEGSHITLCHLPPCVSHERIQAAITEGARILLRWTSSGPARFDGVLLRPVTPLEAVESDFSHLRVDSAVALTCCHLADVVLDAARARDSGLRPVARHLRFALHRFPGSAAGSPDPR